MSRPAATGDTAPACWKITNAQGEAWSNRDGWVDDDPAQFDTFTDAEKARLSLPLFGGCWTPI